jgi:stage V sporulation protein AC
MKRSKQQYTQLYKELSPSSPTLRNLPAAFLAGGTICALGQALLELYKKLGLEPRAAGTAVTVTLIFLGVALTALGVFEKLAKLAGAGTLVPVTGFANSVASPALEFKTEGFILGTCVKMFTIAGPVLVCGTVASVLYGLVLWFLNLAP